MRKEDLWEPDDEDVHDFLGTQEGMVSSAWIK